MPDSILVKGLPVLLKLGHCLTHREHKLVHTDHFVIIRDAERVNDWKCGAEISRLLHKLDVVDEAQDVVLLLFGICYGHRHERGLVVVVARARIEVVGLLLAKATTALLFLLLLLALHQCRALLPELLESTFELRYASDVLSELYLSIWCRLSTSLLTTGSRIVIRSSTSPALASD